MSWFDISTSNKNVQQNMLIRCKRCRTLGSEVVEWVQDMETPTTWDATVALIINNIFL